MISYSAEISPLDCGAFEPTYVIRVIAKDSFSNKHEVGKGFTFTLWGARFLAQRMLWRKQRFSRRLKRYEVLR